MPDPLAIFIVSIVIAWSLVAAWSYHRGMHP
jgi:hypothetical protein